MDSKFEFPGIRRERRRLAGSFTIMEQGSFETLQNSRRDAGVPGNLLIFLAIQRFEAKQYP